MFTNHLKSVMNVLRTSWSNLLMNLLIIPMSIFFGDINYDMFKDDILSDLCDIYDMKNIVTGPTCFKSEKPTLLDVFLTNKPNSLCISINIDTKISDFHNLTGFISRAHAPKCGKRVIKYRSIKHFNVEEYSRDMHSVPFHTCDIFDDVGDIVWAHEQLVTSVIDSHTPLKQRCVKNDQIPFMNATLRKAIHQRNMWRSRSFGDKRNTTAREKYVFWRNVFFLWNWRSPPWMAIILSNVAAP